MDDYGQTRDVSSEELKRAIAMRKVTVVNLALTSDYRLTDRKEAIYTYNVCYNNISRDSVQNSKLTKVNYRESMILEITNKNKNSRNGNNGEYSSKNNNDLELYHGSRDGIDGDIKPISRVSTDFSVGFYTEDRPEQALSIIRDNGTNKLFYSLYVDLEHNTNGQGLDLQVYNFEDIEKWALYIAYNRGRINNAESYTLLMKLINEINKYDIIIGDIADDRMFQAFNEFFDMNMSIDALAFCLSKAQLGKQYVFKTEKACQIIRYGNIRKYNKDTDDKVTDILREDIKLVKNTVIAEAKVKYRGIGEYIDQILERYK